MHNEDEYLKSLKKEDEYHFSIPFEYIEKNYGNDEYDIAEANMEVDAKWSDEDNGYVISHYTPDMDKIDPGEGNSDETEFYEYAVEPEVLSKLEEMGIGAEAIANLF